MAKKRIFSEFLKYSSLSVLGMTGISLYILADTFFISKGLGANGLAALNIAIPVYSLIHGCGLMLGMGAATKYTVLKSRGEQKSADKVFVNTLYAGIFLAVIFVFSGLFLSGRITSLLGADSQVFEMTETYIKVLMFFSPAFILNNIIICFVRNDGSPNLSMAGMITGSLANIVLDYIFIFPLNMGIFGAVIATGFSPIISIAVLSVHFILKKNGFHIVKTYPKMKIIAEEMYLGLPSFVSEMSSGIVILLFNYLILDIGGNTGVAAYGIIANTALVVNAVFTGISQGAQPLISAAYGNGKEKDVSSIRKYSVISALSVAAFIFIIVMIFNSEITDIFNSEKNVILQETAEYGIRLYFISVFFTGLNIVLSVFFTSTENPVPAHIISLLRGFVLIIPAAVLMSKFFGITGVWLASPVTEAIVTLIGVFLFFKTRKQIKKK